MRSATFRLFDRTPPWVVVGLGLLMLFAVSVMDWATGPDLGMHVFYLLPVAFVTVALGWRAGTAIAVTTVAVWSAAELMGAADYADWWTALPNALMRMVYLALVVYLLSVWRDLGKELERQVEQRTKELVAEVAERRHAEEAVHRLAMQVADAEDAERRRLAQDIHDTVGQSLTLLKFRLQAAASAEAAVAGGGGGAGPTTAGLSAGSLSCPAETLDLLDDAIRQTRTLTFELYPPMLDDLGLASALRWLARELTRQTGTEVTIAEEGEPRPLPRPIVSCLFRSIRELINNAIKHGRSTEVFVTIHWRPQSVRAVVDDNGQGFDAAAAAAGTPTAARGLGLASVRERFNTLGGSFGIESERGKGARVIIDVPAGNPQQEQFS